MRSRKRFLDWLASLIEQEGVDVLLVAGDIFDTTTPGSRALTLYYLFSPSPWPVPLAAMWFLIGGNHDSPALLEAPSELLRQLQIHVVGAVADSLDKEVLLLRATTARPNSWSVPYLSCGTAISATAVAGESLEEKGDNLATGH